MADPSDEKTEPLVRRPGATTSLPGTATTGARTAVASDSMGQISNEGMALALGGGGARGIAHIPILEAIDELGIKLQVIAGTSIGSLIGACYASGMPGRDIRSFVLELFERRSTLIKRLFTSPSASWSSMFRFSTAAVVEPDKLFELILPTGLPDTIEQLSIPLKVVTTDYLTQSQVILDKGPLLPAVGASSALPALLAPVRHEGRLLIDGGFVNPTPFDIIADQDRHTVAVDLTSRRESAETASPDAIDLLIGSTQVALHQLVKAKLACSRPSLLISPNVGRFHSMDFYKVKDILAVGDASKEETKHALARLVGGPRPALGK